jgi:hypothetical protein
MRAGSVALLVLSSACGATRATPTSAPEPSSDEIPVQIDNQNFNAMEIYVVTNGGHWLVGQTGGLSKTTLTIRNVARGDGRLRLLASPIGGDRRVTTPTLVVPPGQRIFWTIGSDLATSFASTG